MVASSAIEAVCARGSVLSPASGQTGATATVHQFRTSEATSLIAVEGITKAFGYGAGRFAALDGVTLAIRNNEFFTLLGPSGCGKTTLLRLLAGFDRPTSGAILLDGVDVAGQPPNKRPVNTVFQSYALFPHMTVEQNVAFGLEMKGADRRSIRETVSRMLALVRLEHVAKRRPHQLSGGQQQRVALARSLAPHPKMLLLDEPLSALDFKLRRGMQAELKRIQLEAGITFVLVTHDQEEALSMSDRIAVMESGRVLQIGTPADVYDRPNCRFVADFVGEANVRPGKLLGRTSPFAAVRPARVELVESAVSEHVCLLGAVLAVTFLGSSVACSVRLPDGSVVKSQRAEVPEGLRPGDEVACLIRPEHVMELDR